MKKIIALPLALVLGVTGCSSLKEKHVYHDVREYPPLQVPEGLSAPRPDATLAVPPAHGPGGLITEVTPPGMAFQVRQSDDGKVLIESQDGLPVLTYFGGADTVRAVLDGLEFPEGWRMSGQDAGCGGTLEFADPQARAASELGFFKRVFTRQGRVLDHSGRYVLRCRTTPGKVVVTMLDAEGNAPPALLVDDVLGGLYQALVKVEKNAG